MPKTAFFWIRDGVLVDRMHVNPVAFAIAAIHYGDGQAAAKVGLTRLINFGFETSGISCADKMAKFNTEYLPLVADIQSAAQYYNLLAVDAGNRCTYFPGVCDLLASLKNSGVLHFITSAVEQSVLDTWSKGQQGALIAPYITEILGQRPDFNKGKDHFAYVRERYGVEQIFYVADAAVEIRAGAEYSQLFNIVPIGFAHQITTQRVREAYELIMDLHDEHSSLDGGELRHKLPLVEAELVLPDKSALAATLKNAGAFQIVSGRADEIVENLNKVLSRCGLS